MYVSLIKIVKVNYVEIIISLAHLNILKNSAISIEYITLWDFDNRFDVRL